MQRKQYKDTVICFRRAKDEREETYTIAHIAEKNKRRQVFIVNTELAKSYFWTATDNFMKLNLIANAVRNLERFKEFEKTTEL